MSDEHLKALLDKARNHVMSREEADAQLVSSIYGMQKLSEPGMSLEQIRAVLEELGIVRKTQ